MQSDGAVKLTIPAAPPPPPPPPPLNNANYFMHFQRRHLDMLNGVTEQFVSAKDQVQKKCTKELEKSESTAIESESTGQKQLRNMDICTQCPKCANWIENNQYKQHISFHAALIIDGLLLGDRFSAQSPKELIERNKVTHVVNASLENPNFLEKEGLKYIKLELADAIGEDVIGEAIRGAQFIRKSRDEEKGVVFVHCTMGKSRSVSTIIMYLMNYHSMSYQQSLQLIRKVRPLAKPNITYEASLREYYQAKAK